MTHVPNCGCPECHHQYLSYGPNWKTIQAACAEYNRRGPNGEPPEMVFTQEDRMQRAIEAAEEAKKQAIKEWD